jgi:23S rRNA (cytidine1920-2'-O)/16S rRNA (cytidine1409-2'-O)-methyltransferase
MLRRMRRRLDAELVRRGLLGTRSAAADAIRDGLVTIEGRPASKAGTLVAPDQPVALAKPPRRFVSRAGEKLAAALLRFGVDPTGRRALDVGASTGGFTDALLRGGAAHVVAVDVGYGQLDWSLRTDPRVSVLERTNARALRPEILPYRPDLATVDVSFISLRLVLPALAMAVADRCDAILLVKPQFEAGRADVGHGGVVRDPAVWTRVIEGVASACDGLDLPPVGIMASPLLGPAGNVEFLVHAVRPAPVPAMALDDPAIERAIREGTDLRAARG